jgi:hypothetical protein
VDGGNGLGLAQRRPEQPEDQRNVADLIQDRADAIRVGDYRFQAGRQNFLRVARIARRSSSPPSGGGQVLAQLLAAASAADDQRPRQVPPR